MTKLLALLLPVALFTAAAFADPSPAKVARFEIRVTENGFEPEITKVPAKKAVTLVFVRKTDATCTKSVVLTLDSGKTIERELPLDKPVEIAATFPKAGKRG